MTACSNSASPRRRFTVAAVERCTGRQQRHVITNVARIRPSPSPRRLLLANDTDPEGSPVTITAVGGASGLNAGPTLGAGVITLADNGTAGGSFTYTASDGTATDPGNRHRHPRHRHHQRLGAATTSSSATLTARRSTAAAAMTTSMPATAATRSAAVPATTSSSPGPATTPSSGMPTPVATPMASTSSMARQVAPTPSS